MQFVVDSKIAMNLVGIKQRLERSSDDGGMNTDFDAFAYFRGCLQKKTNHKCYTLYTVLTNFTDDGYDYYIAINQNEPLWMDYQVQLSPEKANEFELIAIPEGQYLVCQDILEFVKGYNIDRIYTLGGMAIPQPVEEPKVYGAATDEANIELLKEAEIEIRSNDGGIVGASGLFLGLGLRQGISGTCRPPCCRSEW